jgi:hypothetical protein
MPTLFEISSDFSLGAFILTVLKAEFSQWSFIVLAVYKTCDLKKENCGCKANIPLQIPLVIEGDK